MGVVVAAAGHPQCRLQRCWTGAGTAGTCLRDKSTGAAREGVHSRNGTRPGSGRRAGDDRSLRLCLVPGAVWQQAGIRRRAVPGRLGAAADIPNRSWVHQPCRDLGAFPRTNVRRRAAAGSLGAMLRRDVQLQSVTAGDVLAPRRCLSVAEVTSAKSVGATGGAHAAPADATKSLRVGGIDSVLASSARGPRVASPGPVPVCGRATARAADFYAAHTGITSSEVERVSQRLEA